MDTDLYLSKPQQRIVAQTLGRLDEKFTDLLYASQKAYIYLYDSAWRESDCEGCAYVYRRSTFPFYVVVVFNRKNLTDLTVDCIPDSSVELDKNFVVLKTFNSKKIFGFWFEKESESVNFHKVVYEILNKRVS